MTEVVALFNERLNEALEKRDMRPVDLANRTDIPEATISQYRSGYAKPESNNAILRYFQAVLLTKCELLSQLHTNRDQESRYIDCIIFTSADLSICFLCR